MYSRYSGISIPQNYSGSRFAPISEPSVKAHKPSLGGATKSAHSPSFVSSLYEESNNEAIKNSSELEEEIIEQEPKIEENSDEQEALTKEDDVSCDKELCDTPVDARERFDLTKIKSVLAKFDKDALLILGLILLLMSDGDKNNDEIIAILALLLLG